MRIGREVNVEPPSRARPSSQDAAVGDKTKRSLTNLRNGREATVEPPSRRSPSSQDAAVGDKTKRSLSEVWRMLVNGFESTGQSFGDTIGFGEPSTQDHVKLRVTASSEGCGPTGTEYVRSFYFNSDEQNMTSSFAWCGEEANGGACRLSLELGGPTLHHDIGMLRLRGCPVGDGYTGGETAHT